MNDRQKFVNMAASFIGCKETDGSHRQIIDTYNAHKPLARGYAVKYTDAWCATFVSAMAIKCRLTDIIPTECSCSRMIDLFKKRGAWQENDAHAPKPGDIIFYDWDDTGRGDNTGQSDHVGVVEKVSGSNITVIEGNYSNAVKRRTLAVNGKHIRGYGVPKYKAGNAQGFKVGDKVKCAAGVKKFSNGSAMASWVPSTVLYVRAVESGGKILLVSTERTKKVYTGRVNASDVRRI